MSSQNKKINQQKLLGLTNLTNQNFSKLCLKKKFEVKLVKDSKSILPG